MLHVSVGVIGTISAVVITFVYGGSKLKIKGHEVALQVSGSAVRKTLRKSSRIIRVPGSLGFFMVDKLLLGEKLSINTFDCYRGAFQSSHRL